MGSAAFDRDGGPIWAAPWAEAYVAFAAGEKRAMAARAGRALLPARRLGRARRLLARSATATRCPASMSPGAPGRASSSRSSGACATAQARGLVTLRFRHRVDGLTSTGRRGRRRAAATCWSPTAVERGAQSSREVVGQFELHGPGCDRRLRRHRRQSRSGARRTGPSSRRAAAPHDLSGVPDHVDGRMIGIAEKAGAQLDQPRPHVALPRGHPEPHADLAAPRHPHPAAALARCGSTPRASACRRRCSPASTPSAPCSTSRRRPRLFLVRAQPADHRRSSRSPAPSRTPTSPAQLAA